MTAAADAISPTRELVINGHSIFVRATDLPHDIDDLLQALIAAWVAKHGRASGLAAGELTAIPIDDVERTWMLVDRRYGHPTYPRTIVSLETLIACFRGGEPF